MWGLCSIQMCGRGPGPYFLSMTFYGCPAKYCEYVGHLNLMGPVGLNSLSTPESDPRCKNAQKNDLVVKTALRIK